MKTVQKTITVAELIIKEKKIENDSKILASKLAKTRNKQLYIQLLSKQDELQHLKLLRLKVNQEQNNNERIVKLSILERQEENLRNLLKERSKEVSLLNNKFINNIKSKIKHLVLLEEEDIYKKIESITSEKEQLKKELTDFNNNTKITINI